MLKEFLGHPVIYEDEEQVLQELNELVQDHTFDCGVTIYPPKYGETLYYRADNDGAEEVFNAAIAQG